MHLRKRICQHFANDWSAKTGRTSNVVKYDPSKSVAWTRNVHLLSSDLSEARSATSEEVRGEEVTDCGSYRPEPAENVRLWHDTDESARFDDVRSSGAGSTGRRNTSVKSLCWGFKLQGLTWSFV